MVVVVVVVVVVGVVVILSSASGPPEQKMGLLLSLLSERQKHSERTLNLLRHMFIKKSQSVLEFKYVLHGIISLWIWQLTHF